MSVPEHYENASVIAPNDFDGDGDIDLFVGSNAVSADFGKIPNSYLLKNDNGRFESLDLPDLRNAGMITSAVWDDFDGDGRKDLIVTGEWMPPKFYRNTGSTLELVSRVDEPLNGLWQAIIPFDIDGDGDTDYLLGNWGTNSKFRAGPEKPLRMYYGDFDSNGSTETILAMASDDKYYPIDGLQELSGQLISLRKKFKTYREFAGSPIEEVLGAEGIKKATVLEVAELRSGFLENQNGKFNFVPFSAELQLAPVKTFLRYDFDGNGRDEVLVAGNFFGVKPYHGRFGSFPGAMISSKIDVVLGNQLGLDLAQKSARHLNIITLAGQAYLLVTFNNEKAQVYRLLKKQ
jgi:hypothetical protein